MHCGKNIHIGLMLMIMMGIMTKAVLADTISITNMRLTMNQGTIAINTDEKTAFPQKAVTASDQMSETSLSLTIIDNRGTAVGWSVSANQTHLTTWKITADESNTGNATITKNDNSRYDGTMLYQADSLLCTYVLQAIPDDQFTVNLQGGSHCIDDNMSSVTFGENINKIVGSKGLAIDVSGTASIGDTWFLKTDVLPFHATAITCQDAVSLSGSLDGMSKGSCGSFSGIGSTSDSQIILTAGYGNGMGQYTQQIDVRLTVHKNALSGTYTGFMYFTIT